MEDNQDHIDDLIGKVLSGEATSEEESSVDAWISENDANRRHYLSVRTIFEKATSKTLNQRFDTDRAWIKVQSKLKKRPTSTSSSIFARGTYEYLFSSRMMRIAAGIVLLVGVSYLVYQLSYPTPQTMQLVSGAVTVQDTLPDGSTTFLNKKSKIDFEYDARQKTRKVKLSGEAYFDVKHVEEKPFIIETNEVLIRDIGTAFNVKAYEESKTVEVIVESGEVHIYTLKNPGIDLVAGEKGVYDKTSREFSKVMKSDTNSLSYRTRVFSFNNSDLGTVITMINDVYGVKIRMANESLSQCHLTVNFNNESIDTVIEVLSETLNLKVTRLQDEIILDGSGCK